MTKEEAKNVLFQRLELEGSIIFHVYEAGGKWLVGSEIIGNEDDLYESDRFYDYGYDNYWFKDFDIGIVNTYMIGDGESDHACASDCAIIEDMLNSPEYGDALWEYLEEDADFINACVCGSVPNPCYVDDEDEDDEEDE